MASERLAAVALQDGRIAVVGRKGLATLDTSNFHQGARWQQPVPDMPGLTCHALASAEGTCKIFACGGRTEVDGTSLQQLVEIQI